MVVDEEQLAYGESIDVMWSVAISLEAVDIRLRPHKNSTFFSFHEAKDLVPN